MPNLKTEVRGLTHLTVGLKDIDKTIDIDGSEYYLHLALFDETGNNLIEVNTKDSCVFTSLKPDTDYIIWTVITDGAGNIKQKVDDTDVHFKSLSAELYKAVVLERNGGDIMVRFPSPVTSRNCYWMHDDDQSEFDGFGVGFELRDANEDVISTKYWEDLTASYVGFSAVTEYARIVPFLWYGQRDISKRVKWMEISEVGEIPVGKFDFAAFPNTDSAEIHVRLEEIWGAEMFCVYNGEEEIITVNNPMNKVYVVPLNDLSSDTDYSLDLTIRCGGIIFLSILNFSTQEDPYHPIYERPESRFKDFWIAVGQPGAYSSTMQYEEVFGAHERFGIKIKHAPYSPMSKLKNMVVQSWKDENGDDVWLPRRTGSQQGTYEPAIVHDAVDYHPTFVIFGRTDKVNSNVAIREFIKTIQGRWLKVWDEYTQMGYEGVYLEDVDDDPKFKRRSYDFVQFVLKFRVNGNNIDAPFEGIGV